MRTLALVALGLLAAGSLPAQAPDLEPTGYVNDFVGVLSRPVVGQLENLAVELKQKTGAEIAVAIVPSLEGDSIENYTNLLAEKWGVGDQEDRGVLLLLAIEDRQLRVEVGYGIEPILPDGRAGEVRDNMTPALREGDYDAAVSAGFFEIARIIADDAGVELTGLPAERPRRRDDGPSFLGWLPLIIILAILLLPRRRRQGGWRGPLWTSFVLGGLGGFHGRGFRGGGIGGSSGFGGGGFGGFGGGSFGGGGASGSW